MGKYDRGDSSMEICSHQATLLCVKLSKGPQEQQE